jgi:hypothetical protein
VRRLGVSGARGICAPNALDHWFADAGPAAENWCALFFFSPPSGNVDFKTLAASGQ